jgi:hypothetical protein
MEQDRRQEEDRRVEVQDGGDDSDKTEPKHERRARAGAKTSEAGTCRREQAVTFRDDADEQQAGDERERRPNLSGCGA